MSSILKSHNQRIIKNSIFLYVRLLITLIIGLYTSRILLQELGVEDYGIYNVVGGVVTMMSFVNNSMAVATQRFLTIELGKQSHEEYAKIFSMCLQIYIVLCFIVILLAETIGVWFVNTQLVIPEDRLTAANCVFQLSLFVCCISMIIIPYNASVIAYEYMSFFAYISILEAVLKCLIVVLLPFFSIDKLSLYGVLLFGVVLVDLFIYVFFCKKYCKGSDFKFINDIYLCKRLLSYSGWNLFGSVAMVGKGQGLNILLGMFFGPTVNAARGIAYQINGLVAQFFTSFYTAVRPQITKYYAQNKMDDMKTLVYSSSKFSFYLILFVSLPIVLQCPYLINLWLGYIPDYVVPFVRIIIIITAIDALSQPLMTAIQATGNIKKYQITIGFIILLNIPFSYFFLKMGMPAISVFYVSVIISFVAHFYRVLFVKYLLTFSLTQYIREVFLYVLGVVVTSCILPIYFYFFYFEDYCLKNFLSIVLISSISVFFSVYIIGLSKNEKMICLRFLEKIRNTISKRGNYE